MASKRCRVDSTGSGRRRSFGREGETSVEQGLDLGLKVVERGSDGGNPHDGHTIPFVTRKPEVSKTGLGSATLAVSARAAPDRPCRPDPKQTFARADADGEVPSARPDTLVEDLLKPCLGGAF